MEWLEELIDGIGHVLSDSFEELWETVSGSMWNIFLKWIYNAIYSAIADFFTVMGNMGAGIFDLSWVEATLKLFSLFGWSLFIAGLAVAIFDIAIEYQSMGRFNIKQQLMPIIYGFLAVNLFTVVPVRIYTLSESGAWVIGFDKISEYFNTDVNSHDALGEMLINELCLRDDVLDIRATDDCIEMKYYTDQITDQEDKTYMSLYSLMRSNLEDVHIVDVDEEHDLATIVELNQDTLTEDGKRNWSDVLGAKVERIFEGYYGFQIAVSGCAPERLEAFSKMLAGECSIEDSERWLNNPDTGESFEIK